MRHSDNTVLRGVVLQQARQATLLRAGQVVFGTAAHSIAPPDDEKCPNQLLNKQGELVAFCWFGDSGYPEFLPWCDHCAN